jgi:signal transduction protein with GAF and PtsI domain
VRSERINADWAVERAAAEVQELFARDGDAWLRERAGDLTDVDRAAAAQPQARS